MFFTIELTGEVETWGAGILNPDRVVQFANYFALKPGFTDKDIANPTITIVPCSDEEVLEIRSKYQIPDDWIPHNGAFEQPPEG
jgi:hypothetical protein